MDNKDQDEAMEINRKFIADYNNMIKENLELFKDYSPKNFYKGFSNSLAVFISSTLPSGIDGNLNAKIERLDNFFNTVKNIFIDIYIYNVNANNVKLN